MSKNIFCCLIIALSLSIGTQAQRYRSPLNIPMILSSNFGELRPNHFHSGIDIKTQGRIGLPVHTIADGYISRVSVSPSGYGNAVYVTHYDGHTSVYGHLSRFIPKVKAAVREKEYEKQSFSVNVYFSARRFPVRKGDVIAYSGDTGSSGGPHVHFEVRNTKSEDALDPLAYFARDVKDSLCPVFKGIAVYPVVGKGVVNHSDEPYYRLMKRLADGHYEVCRDQIGAWGKIGLGVAALDRMNGTTNIYGVKNVSLYCDGKKVFAIDIARIIFGRTKMINSFTDYDYWFRHKMFFMKSFKERGNELPIYKYLSQNGYVFIDQQRDYHLRYELEDYFGNKSEYSFMIRGQKQGLSSDFALQQLNPSVVNELKEADCRVYIPVNSLYDTCSVKLFQKASESIYSDRFQIGDKYIPLRKNAEISIALKSDDLKLKRQYGLWDVSKKHATWAGGHYKNGVIVFESSELGHSYEVGVDQTAPHLVAVSPKTWVKRKKILLKAFDNKSGIGYFKGWIDGKFVLFEHDCKSKLYTYEFDNERLERRKKHRLVFEVKDRCGNSSKYISHFIY